MYTPKKLKHNCYVSLLFHRYDVDARQRNKNRQDIIKKKKHLLL